MARFAGITAGLLASVAALAVPAAPLETELPSCGSLNFVRGPAGASYRPRLELRVSTIPAVPRGTDGIRWVVTVTNPTSRPRRLSFWDSAYAEIQLWQGGSRVYSWYGRRLWLQQPWAFVVPPRSTGSCTQFENKPLDVRPGRYTLVAYLRTADRQPRIRRAIAVS